MLLYNLWNRVVGLFCIYKVFFYGLNIRTNFSTVWRHRCYYCIWHVSVCFYVCTCTNKEILWKCYSCIQYVHIHLIWFVYLSVWLQITMSHLCVKIDLHFKKKSHDVSLKNDSPFLASKSRLRSYVWMSAVSCLHLTLIVSLQNFSLVRRF